jgi:DnaJ family protein A protein 5
VPHRIKKAYRRKALELHPDRNYGDVENATAKFAEVQSAYEVLSDPQERAWYDSHRESILRGGGAPEAEDFERNVRLTSAGDIMNLMGRFTTRLPFTDGPNGFYGILQRTFENLAAEEDSACDWQGLDPEQYPEFGGTESDYEDVVKPFYRIWMNFSTKKTFSWRDAYRASDAPDRATRRIIDKENKRIRDEGIREFNDAVRALVAFVRKRDPRFIPNSQSEADRQKILRDAAAAQAARSRAANQAKLNQHVVPDWAKIGSQEEEDVFSDSSESEIEHIECVVCNKTFKSEKQYETHEKSKKHIKAVQALQREMRQENRRLNLDNPSSSGFTTPTEALGGLDDLELESTEVEAIDEPSANSTRENAESPPGAKSQEDNDPQKEFPEKSSGKSVEADSDSSDIDDDYAPRENVEHRLGNSLAVSQKMEQELNASNPAAGVGTTDSDNTTTSKKTVGKAKAKRAKKAARQEIEGAEAGQQVNRETQWTKDAKKLIYHSSNALPARVRSLLGRSFSTISKN